VLLDPLGKAFIEAVRFALEAAVHQLPVSAHICPTTQALTISISTIQMMRFSQRKTAAIMLRAAFQNLKGTN